MRAMKTLAAVAAVAVLFTGCTNQKEPAEKALAGIEASLSGFKEDAQKYAADELKSVEETVGKLKSEIAAKNYDAVVMQAPGVTSTVTALKESVAKKKAEAEEMMAAATQEWNELSASVPETVGKLQEKFDSFAKSKKLPKGLDKAAFESAKQEFEALKTSWTEAGSEFTSGMAGEAVRKARAAKAKAEELLQKFSA
jgi:hypothetical protein